VSNILLANFVRELDKESGKPILRGTISFNDLLRESTCHWLTDSAKTYTPNEFVLSELGRMWHDYRFVVFAGTWCEDTQHWLPRFYKTIQEADIPEYAIEMYGVDRKKRALNHEEKVYKILYVPTIIVMHQQREVGRIVESPAGSIEEALLNIIAEDRVKRGKM
jgi:hypothetical protein